MAVGDLYEVTLHGTLQGQTCDNVFHYEQDVSFVSTLPTPAHDVALCFENQVLPKMAAFSSADLTWTEIRVRNLFDDSDAALKLISETGVIGSGGGGVDTLPAFATITFTMDGDNASVGQGRKAQSGVGESYQTDGVVSLDTGFVGDLQDYADQLAAPLLSEPLLASELFIPVVVKRVRSGTPGNYTYRLPSSAGEKVVSHILVAAWNLLVSTQNSRKYGVGS